MRQWVRDRPDTEERPATTLRRGTGPPLHFRLIKPAWPFTATFVAKG
jgi:hypothetical protein